MSKTPLPDEQLEKAAIYAAGAMEAESKLACETEMEADPSLRREVEAFRGAAALMAAATPVVSPSPDARRRLMAQAEASAAAARPAPATSNRWLGWALGASTVAAVGALAWSLSEVGELRRINDALSSRVAELQNRLSEERVRLATMSSSSVRVVTLGGQNQNSRASGRIFWDENRNRWLFFAKDLPKLSSDLAYQLWFVPVAGQPVSATVFNTDDAGTATIDIPLPDRLDSLKAAAVTTEPAGGLPQPSGAFALLGAFTAND